MTILHDLNSMHLDFRDLWSSRRTFELLPDLEFKQADVLHLHELDMGGERTSRSVLMLVISVDNRSAVLCPGFVALSLKLLTRLDGGAPCGMQP